jgi:hypothetical protein
MTKKKAKGLDKRLFPKKRKKPSVDWPVPKFVPCTYCGESLKFIPGKGWVHRKDGKMLRQKKAKDRYGNEILVDDHSALPDWKKAKEGINDEKFYGRESREAY